MTKTICAKCIHLDPDLSGTEKWMCLAPWERQIDLLTGEKRLVIQRHCSIWNKGNCEHFTNWDKCQRIETWGDVVSWWSNPWNFFGGTFLLGCVLLVVLRTLWGIWRFGW